MVIGQDPSTLPLLAESGKIVNLAKPLAAETATLYPGIRSALFYKGQQLVYKGQQLGMALGGVGDYVLFYNKTDFAKAGIGGPPATWTQLEADAIKLSDRAASLRLGGPGAQGPRGAHGELRAGGQLRRRSRVRQPRGVHDRRRPVGAGGLQEHCAGRWSRSRW